jgi:hypothetical protein
MITDAKSKIIRVNRAFEQLTGYTEAEVLGENPRIFNSGRHDPIFYTQIQVENSAKIMQNKELIKTSGNGTWLKFNGGKKTSEEERLKNSKELSQLVQNTYWCTKTNSKSQLDGGDFYVYVTETNGEVFPRIAIRMKGDNVGEVRGNKSASQDIEEEMLPVAEKFLTENITNGSGQKWLEGIKYNQEAIKLYDKISKKGLFKNSVEEFIELKSKENLICIASGSTFEEFVDKYFIINECL